jgi:hypothetical protein
MAYRAGEGFELVATAFASPPTPGDEVATVVYRFSRTVPHS